MEPFSIYLVIGRLQKGDGHGQINQEGQEEASPPEEFEKAGIGEVLSPPKKDGGQDHDQEGQGQD